MWGRVQLPLFVSQQNTDSLSDRGRLSMSHSMGGRGSEKVWQFWHKDPHMTLLILFWFFISPSLHLSLIFSSFNLSTFFLSSLSAISLSLFLPLCLYLQFCVYGSLSLSVCLTVSVSMWFFVASLSSYHCSFCHPCLRAFLFSFRSIAEGSYKPFDHCTENLEVTSDRTFCLRCKMTNWQYLAKFSAMFAI